MEASGHKPSERQLNVRRLPFREYVPLQTVSGVRTMQMPPDEDLTVHHKARFKVVVHDPIRLQNTGDRNADIAAGVGRVNAFIEDCVRARPAEWFWVHKRWPNEIYKKLKG